MILGVVLIRCNTQDERLAPSSVHGPCTKCPASVCVRFAGGARCTLDTGSKLGTIR